MNTALATIMECSECGAEVFYHGDGLCGFCSQERKAELKREEDYSLMELIYRTGATDVH